MFTYIYKKTPLSINRLIHSLTFMPLSSHSHSISPSHSLHPPLSSSSLILSPDSPPPSIIRPNSLTLAPLSSLLTLSCLTINPHPITSTPSFTPLYSHPLSPQSITQLPTPLNIFHPSYPKLSYHSYIPIFLLSHPFLTPLYSTLSFLTPFSHPSLSLSRPSHPFLTPTLPTRSTHSLIPLSHFILIIHSIT